MLGTPNHCDGLLPGMVANLKISQGPCAFEAHAFANLKVPGRRNAALEACRGSMACIEMHWNVKIVKSCQIEKHGADNQPPSTIVIAIALVWKVFPECPWHWVCSLKGLRTTSRSSRWFGGPLPEECCSSISSRFCCFICFGSTLWHLIDCGWCFLLGLFNIWKSSRAAEKTSRRNHRNKNHHTREAMCRRVSTRTWFFLWVAHLFEGTRLPWGEPWAMEPCLALDWNLVNYTVIRYTVVIRF